MALGKFIVSLPAGFRKDDVGAKREGKSMLKVIDTLIQQSPSFRSLVVTYWSHGLFRLSLKHVEDDVIRVDGISKVHVNAIERDQESSVLESSKACLRR